MHPVNTICMVEFGFKQKGILMVILKNKKGGN
jgi:hypothetical protein